MAAISGKIYSLIRKKLELNMAQSHKITFFIIAGIIFLLPLFFIPGGALFASGAKSSLLAFAVIISAIAYVWESYQSGSLSLPWHSFLGVVLLMPFVYFLSAIFSEPTAMSLLGYEIEVGTFAYMAIVAALMLLIALSFNDKSRVLRGLTAAYASLAAIVLFASVKLLLGDSALSLGLFTGNLDNPVGNWTDLAMVASLVSVLSMIAINMASVKKFIRVLLYVFFVISTALLAVLNFSLAFEISLVASVFLFVYFSTIENRFSRKDKEERKSHILLPAILTVVSLLFLINPVVTSSGRQLGEVVSGAFGVSNTEVRPSLVSTLNISASVLKDNPVLGSGPNTFSRDWLAYKPNDINSTQFWNVSFPFGIGFIPTQIATTGALGTLIWLAFFVLFIALGKRVLVKMPESKSERFLMLSLFLGALMLWAASFFYAPSVAVLTLAFVFSGLFVSSSRMADSISVYKFNFKEVPAASFVATLFAVAVVSGSLLLGFSVFQKTASAYYYKKAIDLSVTPNTPVDSIEQALLKAIGFSPSDIHYSALAQLNFTKAQAAASSNEGDPEKNKALFEESLSKSIAAAQAAANMNPSSYRNWMSLGSIYAALVPEPLKVEGAYESAKNAFNEAALHNPSSPEVPLFLARLELGNNDPEAARDFIQQSLSKKSDYADAYFTLTQIEMQEKNIKEAIKSAETGALLSPANPGLYFEIGLLKYSNNNFQGAADSFFKALDLMPNYANAKYYLGLSLAQDGKEDQALPIFEDLLSTNPDSKEVSLILNNLKEGKPVLEGMPPSASDVEERTSPPITGAEQ